MTDEEFNNIKFSKDDEIVVRRYFKREKENVSWVDFDKKTINGYNVAQIEQYIKNN